MFCTQCGNQLGAPEPNFCPTCGKQTHSGRAHQRTGTRRLERPIHGRRIWGVCAGVAEYLDVDVTLIRVLAVIGLFFSAGTGFLAYLIAMIVIPEEMPQPAGVPAAEQRI